MCVDEIEKIQLDTLRNSSTKAAMTPLSTLRENPSQEELSKHIDELYEQNERLKEALRRLFELSTQEKEVLVFLKK